MQIKFSDVRFLHIFDCSPYEFVDIQLVIWWLRSWKWWKSVKFIKIKGPREARPPGIWPEIYPGGRDLTIFENLPGSCPGDGNAWTEWYITAFVIQISVNLNELLFYRKKTSEVTVTRWSLPPSFSDRYKTTNPSILLFSVLPRVFLGVNYHNSIFAKTPFSSEIKCAPHF